MNQRMFNIVLLGSTNGLNTAGSWSSTADLSPSASLAKREMKVIIGAQIITQGTWTFTLTESTTTNGTYSTVNGDTLSVLTGTNGSTSVTEYHMQPTMRYLKITNSTASGATGTVNLFVMVQNLKRTA